MKRAEGRGKRGKKRATKGHYHEKKPLNFSRPKPKLGLGSQGPPSKGSGHGNGARHVEGWLAVKTTVPWTPKAGARRMGLFLGGDFWKLKNKEKSTPKENRVRQSKTPTQEGEPMTPISLEGQGGDSAPACLGKGNVRHDFGANKKPSISDEE